MSLATDLLRQAGLLTATPEKATVSTARGPVRLKKDGTPDKRSLLRGISKPSSRKGTMYSCEKKQLLKMLQSSSPGDTFEWKWRNRNTYRDVTLRNRQTQYARAAAAEFGYKISLASYPKGLQITVIGESDKS